ncbi:phosphotransferase family protein [Mycobacterium paraseoulense]|uniref:Aminoglycoside phosphotransferase domain-containing protein n=1 Tax=Mycobacterium paraseoulense TaxID=590652 RepID=A0A1X0IET4_9MYCO|nr:phosphotransferase family protein [Mycobacterium paraseoulense]MCV7393883.1 phosphotransferase family protein [Mycobacterium paraseoulense]ORB45395.1 hypothetical protein BST39_03980 [Mycobacterium paraseoulense]BBZ70492.1 aminoglycoside phosphotransferase [Mycobacterium paraseoulense]
MTIATQRDIDATGRTLRRWFVAKAGARVVHDVEVTPSKSGFSNETVMCRVRWLDAASTEHDDSLVLRIEPTRHQLFPTSDALHQAAVMQALAGACRLPLPQIRFAEPESRWFGAAFYLMNRIDGRIPTDVPSYHQRGWVAELSAAERARLYDNALARLAELHQLDPRRVASVLSPKSSTGNPLQDYVEHVTAWARWADADLQINRSCITDGLRYVQRARPADVAPVVVWGDARIGNMIFGTDLSVVSMLDWEAATIGPAGIDVGWWLMFEEYICEAGGLNRLPGIPCREAILQHYESLRGCPVKDVSYFEVLAALVFSLINSRLATLLRNGGFDEQRAAQFAERSTAMLGRGLDVAGA